VSGQLHAPAALPLRKRPWYPFYMRLGGPQSRSGRYGEVKIFYPTGTRTPAPLVVQPVASRYTIELSRLLPTCSIVPQIKWSPQSKPYFVIVCVFDLHVELVTIKTDVSRYRTLTRDVNVLNSYTIGHERANTCFYQYIVPILWILIILSCVTQWLKTGFGLVSGFIDHLQVVTPINYYPIADLHNLQ
jgi:hypothetical protein